MNKKIKISILTFIIVFILLSIINTSSAWSPSGLFPISDGGYSYFCRQKGGALRFYDYPGNGYSFTSEQPTNSAPKATTDEANVQVNNKIAEVADKILNKFNELSAGNKAYKSAEYANYNGTFEEWVKRELIAESFIITKDDSDSSNIGYPITSMYDGNWEGVYTNGVVAQTGFKGYALASRPNYSVSNTREVTNSVTAYIMSAGKDWLPADYNRANYQTTKSDVANINDMQDALWLHKNDFGEIYNIGTDYSTNNRALFDEALQYKQFYNDNLSGQYQASIVSPSEPRIIVNKNTGNYIVGPYTVYYPDNNKFSFIEDMYVLDQNGNRIDLVRVISSDGRYYPGNGQSFFVEFSYASNPTNVTVYADFAYLNNTYAKYEELTANNTPIYTMNATITIQYHRTVREYVKKNVQVTSSIGALRSDGTITGTLLDGTERNNTKRKFL